MILKQYERTFNNLDKCLAAFTKILMICQERQDFEIAKVIEECINSLDVKEA